MSRARDNANLGAQAGSGLTASDLTTGTLGNTVQDNITRVGTVGTGTWEGTTVAVAQGGTGVTSKTGTGNVVLSASPTFTGTPVGITAAHLTGAAVLPAAVTGGSGLTAVNAANIASGVLPVGVTGGSGLTGTILASHEITEGAYNNNGGHSAWRASGNYFSFTTQAQTTRIVVWASLQTNVYSSSTTTGVWGEIKLAFHNSTSSGSSPSGGDIGGVQQYSAIYLPSYSGRIDLRDSTTCGGKETVSGSTAYIIQLFTLYGVAVTYMQSEKAAGIVLEFKE